MNIVLRRVN